MKGFLHIRESRRALKLDVKAGLRVVVNSGPVQLVKMALHILVYADINSYQFLARVVLV